MTPLGKILDAGLRRTRVTDEFLARCPLLAAFLLVQACTDHSTAPFALGPQPRIPGPVSTMAANSSLNPGIVYVPTLIPGMADAYAINSSGVVVGHQNEAAAAFVPGEGLVLIGPVIAGQLSWLTDINSAGEAIGFTGKPGGVGTLRWSESTRTKFDLQITGGMYGQGINEDGDVVGGLWPQHAVYRSHTGTEIVLAAPGVYAPYAFDLNAHGMIVGEGVVGGHTVAIVWSSPAASAQSIGTLGGTESRAWQVSDEGDVVGWARTASGVKHAFVFNSSTGMVDLATWPNSCSGESEALAINNNGIIVGRCEGKAVLWTGAEGMRELPLANSLQGEARDINDRNEIVGLKGGGNAAAGVVVWTIAAQPPTAFAGGPYHGVEGSPVRVDGSSSSDPEGGTLTYAWNFGDPAATGGGIGSGISASHTYVEDGAYTVTLTVTDETGLSSQSYANVIVDNEPPVITSLASSAEPIPVGTNVTLQAAFTDAGRIDTHHAIIEWDATSGTGAPETAGYADGMVSSSHVYTTAGVYTIRVTVEDDDGGSDESLFQYVVVYDPGAGFVTGGGWFNSPVGAFQLNPAATGRANFGFVSRYLAGKSVPSGETEFQFRAAGLDFKSTAYEWLVVAGRKARFKGTGTINGAGSYSFALSSEDGNLAGGDGKDRVRIRIWDRSTGSVIYDNQIAASEDADPSTVIGGGSIVLHPN